MDCLICYKVFDKEVEFRTEPPPNPEMCLNIICKLYNIPSSHPELRGIFEDPAICRGCHKKFRVLDKVLKSTEYEIRENLVTSKEASEVAERLSKSSWDRVALLRLIETGGAVPAQNAVISTGGAVTTRMKLGQSLTSQAPRGNAIDNVAREQVQMEEQDPLGIPGVGQANGSSGNNVRNTGESFENFVYIRALLGEGTNYSMEEEEAEPIDI